ncbi:NUDIX domain-containing protein [Candidatus Woesearchaeota archaeon]|jgi:8-oxo-dGTP diphosphatase|nr:NUDIX domain-containing protein [Candidatus Woesearchaeota archaeon]MBT3537297.1 NUDIX domain-containing protein [Candidatus Woesearchaeota archaeon]MBT4696754.1 NUDIX domain-containing protein [Candidatus Woesearchaeota archaeon]MBT4716737.1 NUDIX domain-containing protein [Candidatus Woesearchaeota archaeon]MBT7106393.1 NUDIX domain-containing protein [Candidatus Woesearchaeota archaeon]
MKDVQKAVIKKDDKFLILLRSKTADFFPDYWDFPGGKLEPNEIPEEGIEREVKEETTLTIKAKEVVGVYEYDLTNCGHNDFRFTVYNIEILEGKVKIGFEHQEFKWATKEEVLNLRIEPFLIEYFKEHP